MPWRVTHHWAVNCHENTGHTATIQSHLLGLFELPISCSNSFDTNIFYSEETMPELIWIYFIWAQNAQVRHSCTAHKQPVYYKYQNIKTIILKNKGMMHKFWCHKSEALKRNCQNNNQLVSTVVLDLSDGCTDRTVHAYRRASDSVTWHTMRFIGQ